MSSKRCQWARWGQLPVALLALLLTAASPLFCADIDGTVGDGEYPNRTAFAASDYVLYWKVDSDSAFFAIEARASGWVCLGIDPKQIMSEADMIFGWVDDQGKAGALDCYSTGLFGPHPPDERLGGRSDLLSFAAGEANGLTTFEFSRPLASADPYDKPLPEAGEVAIIWAYSDSDDYLDLHSRNGSAKLNLGTAPAATRVEVAPRLDLYSLLVPVHAALMGTSFVLLLAGMFFPRYFKRKKWWLKIHRQIGIAGGSTGVVGVGMAVYMISRTSQVHLRVVHSFIGLATITLMIVTPIFGHFMLKIKGNPQRAKKIRAAHRWLGRVTLVAMAAAVVLGLLQAGVV